MKTRLGDIAKETAGKKASLPEVLDQTFFEDPQLVVVALEQAIGLKAEISEAEETLDGLKEQLAVEAGEHGLDGLRHNKIVFTTRLNPGRTSVDMAKFQQELLMAGVQADVIKTCLNAATKQGESYWVREITMLK